MNGAASRGDTQFARLSPLWLSSTAAQWMARLARGSNAASPDALVAFGHILSQQMEVEPSFAAGLQAVVAEVLSGAHPGGATALSLSAPNTTRGLVWKDPTKPVVSQYNFARRALPAIIAASMAHDTGAYWRTLSSSR